MSSTSIRNPRSLTPQTFSLNQGNKVHLDKGQGRAGDQHLRNTIKDNTTYPKTLKIHSNFRSECSPSRSPKQLPPVYVVQMGNQTSLCDLHTASVLLLSRFALAHSTSEPMREEKPADDKFLPNANTAHSQIVRRRSPWSSFRQSKRV